VPSLRTDHGIFSVFLILHFLFDVLDQIFKFLAQEGFFAARCLVSDLVESVLEDVDVRITELRLVLLGGGA